jgi:hypothetical protein
MALGKNNTLLFLLALVLLAMAVQLWRANRTPAPGAWLNDMHRAYAERVAPLFEPGTRILVLHMESPTSLEATIHTLQAAGAEVTTIPAYSPDELTDYEMEAAYPAWRLRAILEQRPDTQLIFSLVPLETREILPLLKRQNDEPERKLLLGISAAHMPRDEIARLFEEGVLLAAPIPAPTAEPETRGSLHDQLEARYQIYTQDNWTNIYHEVNK